MRISANIRSPASRIEPPTRYRLQSLPTCYSKHIHLCLILFSMTAASSRRNTKATLSSPSKVRGIVQSRPAIRLCAYHLPTADLKASTRILPLDFGYPASDAQKYGVVLPPLRLPRMDRCWSPMIRVAPSGAFPTLANARAPRRVQMEQRTAPNNLSPESRFAPIVGGVEGHPVSILCAVYLLLAVH